MKRKKKRERQQTPGHRQRRTRDSLNHLGHLGSLVPRLAKPPGECWFTENRHPSIWHLRERRSPCGPFRPYHPSRPSEAPMAAQWANGGLRLAFGGVCRIESSNFRRSTPIACPPKAPRKALGEIVADEARPMHRDGLDVAAPCETCTVCYLQVWMGSICWMDSISSHHTFESMSITAQSFCPTTGELH